MRRVLATLLLALVFWTVAQPRLVVDGLDIPGNTTALVAGRSYAPARALALALGAELGFDGAVATLQLGGRIVSVELYRNAADAAVAAGAFRVDGRVTAAAGGLLVGAEFYLPVQPVIEAFGGQIAFLQAEAAVVATLPRAQLTAAALERSGGGERLRITLSAPVGVSPFFNEPTSTLQLRIDRSSLARAQTLNGSRIGRADLIPGAGFVDVRVAVPAGSDYQLYSVPGTNGSFDLFVALVDGAAASPGPARASIVLDAGHGGSDRGAQFAAFGDESDLTFAFVQALGDAIEALGFEVVHTRDAAAAPPLEARLSLGVGADLFVSVHAAELPAGSYNIYHLDDAGDAGALALAVRSNAETALAATVTDELRREILLGLVPDLELGRRFADSLERQLLQLAGFQVAEATGAPLYVLSGAAGHGLFLEFAPADLADDRFASLLAGALVTVLSSGGFE